MSGSALKHVLVYGGGPAALMVTAELAGHGVAVTLAGPVAASHWPSLPEAGINVGRDPEALFRNTVACGHDRSPRAPIRAMAAEAAFIVDDLTRIGVPLAYETDGSLALRRLDAVREPDAAFVEGRTGQQISRALDAQVRRLSQTRARDEAMVRRLDAVELIALVRDDDGRAVGAVVQDLVSMRMRSLQADAVVLASGGPEKMFDGRGALCVEGGAAVAFAAGALFADAGLVQLHPAALDTSGERLRLLSSALRGESGRFWVPSDAKEVRDPAHIPADERDYFLEDAPDASNLAPDDVCARTIHQLCADGRGLYHRDERDNEWVVYLDISHLPAPRLQERLASELDPALLVTGTSAAEAPLRVRTAVTLCLGGLWVDHEVDGDGMLVETSPRNHSTSIEGMYAVGDVQYLYHGACRMGGNGLLAELFGARLTARAVDAYLRAGECGPGPFERAEKTATKRFKKLSERQGDGSVDDLHGRLRALLQEQLGPGAHGSMSDAIETMYELQDECADAAGSHGSKHADRGATGLRDMENMLTVADIMLTSADAWREAGETAGTVFARMVEGEIELPNRASYQLLGNTIAINTTAGGAGGTD